jgi:membrane protein involved in colicin uptake
MGQQVPKKATAP